MPVDAPLYTRRSVASRRADVARVLTEHPEYSDRRLAYILEMSEIDENNSRTIDQSLT